MTHEPRNDSALPPLPPLPPHRDPADAWVVAPSGERYWGLHGAAGLIAFDSLRGVLLQHRAGWSHHGGTWGLPGGARHGSESALEGALREAAEEAEVPAEALTPVATHLLDLHVWSYTTVVARVDSPFEARVADAESLALRWVRPEEVAELDLHPGLRTSWPALRPLLDLRPALVVDVANVVGSVPDGWWKDRADATARVLAGTARVVAAGLPASVFGVAAHSVLPETVAVVEGAARGAVAKGCVRVVDAAADGDASVLAQVEELRATGATVVVVSSDRGLRRRLGDDVMTLGAGTFRSLMSA
ncbi:NUDIX domain-containing protein [Demequina capsici]|uniref:NUDIX domain-containing protein n=1 Tax=Demequina capsici TaxID=3075620 RepID=A0AA96FAM9_9MICO|nr:NUDIX domain-containing protein [Demequina sp. OYTSA14]WNM25847.1 NUDIX domain-containing protein [Demequina sp. OYTSA14]